MDRQHRRELKHDRFVDEVGLLSSRARENQRLLYSIGAAVILIAVGIYGFYFYSSSQERKAQAELAVALETMDAPIVNPAQPDPKAKFKTEEERNAAAEKQFQAVQARFSGTDAADVAGLYLARFAASRGDTATSRKLLQGFVADHPNHLLVGAARYSLYQMRIDGGEAPQVATEINAELLKEQPVLPPDSLLLLLAHSYDVQGNDAKSRETYRRIVTEFPESPFVLEAQRRVGPA